jgi:hypothetical protein
MFPIQFPSSRSDYDIRLSFTAGDPIFVTARIGLFQRLNAGVRHRAGGCTIYTQTRRGTSSTHAAHPVLNGNRLSNFISKWKYFEISRVDRDFRQQIGSILQFSLAFVQHSGENSGP